MRSIYEILQTALVVLWAPFQWIAKIGLVIHRGGTWLGDNLVRPLYWGVVQAKRRAIGQPLWQQHDFQIGIGPPCEHCDVNVPPGRHKPDCRFLAPEIVQGRPLSVDDLKVLSLPCDPPDACATHGRCWTHSEWEDKRRLSDRESALQGYVYTLQKDGTFENVSDIAGAVAKTLVEDIVKVSERFGLAIEWKKVARACRQLAVKMEARAKEKR